MDVWRWVVRGAWRRATGWRTSDVWGPKNPARGGADMRERLARYFVSREGSVPWQDAAVRRGQLR